MAKESWSQQLIDELFEVCRPKIHNLGEQLNLLGMSSEQMNIRKKIVVDSMTEMLDDYVSEVQEMQEKLSAEIKVLLQTSSRLCKELGIDMPQYGKHNLGFYMEREILREEVKKFESLRETRMKEIEHLENCEQQLCKNLGRIPKGLKTYPLPTSKVILAFENYLEEMEKTKFERREAFCSKKSEIVNLVNELGIEPFMDFEKLVIEKDETDFLVTDSNMERLELFYQSLLKQLGETKEEVEELSKKIEKLWNVLEIDMQERDQFRKKCSGNLLTKIIVLKDELKRLEILKRDNIQNFIEKLRQELITYWDKLQYTQQQRDSFPFFNTSVFTEDLLEIHEREVQKLQAFYEKHSEIYSLLEKHKELFAKNIEMEKGEEQPDRYKNRGGQLLREEQERNRLNRRITTAEDKLKVLAKKYFSEEGTLFLVGGKTIEEYINDLHNAQKEERLLRMSAKKQQREQALTPGKSSFLPSTSSMRTPSTATKRKILTPVPSTDKKLKLSIFNQTKGIKTAPAAKVKRVITTNKIRTSLDRMRKLKKRLSRQGDYSNFENDLENMEPNKRSTTVINLEDEVLAKPLLTPQSSRVKVMLTTPGGRTRGMKI